MKPVEERRKPFHPVKRLSAVSKRLETGKKPHRERCSCFIQLHEHGPGRSRASDAGCGFFLRHGQGYRHRGRGCCCGRGRQHRRPLPGPGGDGGLAATRLRRKPGVDAGAVLLPAAGASLAPSSILEREEAAMRVRSSAGPSVRRHRHLLACYGLCPRPRVSCAGRPHPREKQRQINT